MRRFRSLLVIALFAAVVFFGRGEPAHACSCLQQTYEQHFANADVVFDGITESFVGNEVQSQYLFKVMETFKGATNDPQSVFTPKDSAMCGDSFQKDVAYRIFAKNENGTLKTNLCMGNIKSADAPKLTTTTTPKPTTTKPLAAPTTTTTEPDTTTTSESTTTTVDDQAVTLTQSDDGGGGAGWLLAAIAGVLAVGGIGGWAYMRSRRTDPAL